MDEETKDFCSSLPSRYLTCCLEVLFSHINRCMDTFFTFTFTATMLLSSKYFNSSQTVL